MIGTFGWSVLATLNMLVGGVLIMGDDDRGYLFWIGCAVCLVMAWWQL